MSNDALGKLHTACKGCVFAQYSEYTQTGCKIGVLDKYREITDVLEAYDDDKEFYIINNRKCNSYRPNTWFSAGSSLERQKVVLAEENKFTYQVIIPLVSDLNGLEKTLESLNLSIIKPVHVTVLNMLNQYRRVPKEIDDILEKFVKTKWRVQTQLLSLIDEHGFHDNEELALIDNIMKFAVFAPYYMVVHSGSVVNRNLCSNINKALNEDLAVLPYIDGEPTVVNQFTHKILQGNVASHLLDKINNLGEDKCPNVSNFLR